MVGYNHQNTQAILSCTLKPNQALPKHFLTIVSDSKVWSYFCQNQYTKTHKDDTLDKTMALINSLLFLWFYEHKMFLFMLWAFRTYIYLDVFVMRI